MQCQIQLGVGVDSESICCCLDRSEAIMSKMLLPSAGSCRNKMRGEFMSGSAGSDGQLGDSHSWKRSNTLSCQKKDMGQNKAKKKSVQ